MIPALICTVLVSGTSMMPHLEPSQEYLFELFQDTTTTTRGDFVVILASPKHIVKRIAAVPGDTLAALGLGFQAGIRGFRPKVVPAGWFFVDSAHGDGSRTRGLVKRAWLKAILRKRE